MNTNKIVKHTGFDFKIHTSPNSLKFQLMLHLDFTSKVCVCVACYVCVAFFVYENLNASLNASLNVNAKKMNVKKMNENEIYPCPWNGRSPFPLRSVNDSSSNNNGIPVLCR